MRLLLVPLLLPLLPPPTATATDAVASFFSCAKGFGHRAAKQTHDA